MHLVDQEQGARAGGLRDLSHLSQQVGQVLLGVARVRDAGGRLHVELCSISSTVLPTPLRPE